MFEGKLTAAHKGAARDPWPGEQDELRPITWPELLAQLEAAREFRAALGAAESRAGFACERGHRRLATGKSERAVNLVDSADGKPSAAISRWPSDAARADRES